MIIVRIYEGLGNQLFQYAYARTLALSSEHEVLLDARETGSLKKEKKGWRHVFLCGWRD